MIDKTSYRLSTDKVIYEPKGLTQDKAIETAGRISAFENLPVELRLGNEILNVRFARPMVERAR